MTREERLRLAKAARELAMECVNGAGALFGCGVEFYADGIPACALGHVAARAGIWPSDRRLYVLGDLCGNVAIQERNIVARANDNLGERDALPWALLSLADALATAESGEHGAAR